MPRAMVGHVAGLASGHRALRWRKLQQGCFKRYLPCGSMHSFDRPTLAMVAAVAEDWLTRILYCRTFVLLRRFYII